ncbi:hypothetical protein ACTTAI_16230 [Rhodobacter capsulatus]|uniref:hypothetical protein n=1 Tax=Rhodobacter capsulatus TaxID=1061 RepID=UPI0040284435
MRLLSRLILTLIPRAVLAEVLDRAVADDIAEIRRRAEVLTFRIGAVERQLGQHQRALFRRTGAAVADASFAESAPEGAMFGPLVPGKPVWRGNGI